MVHETYQEPRKNNKGRVQQDLDMDVGIELYDKHADVFLKLLNAEWKKNGKIDLRHDEVPNISWH